MTCNRCNRETRLGLEIGNRWLCPECALDRIDGIELPAPGTLARGQYNLRGARRDFGYELIKPLGLLWLIRRLGMQPKDWVRIREEADQR